MLGIEFKRTFVSGKQARDLRECLRRIRLHQMNEEDKAQIRDFNDRHAKLGYNVSWEG